MTDDLKLRQWDRCWPGNINLEVAVDEALARITDLEAKLQRLGRELNLAKYGEPDFAWEIHKNAVADLEARLAAAVEVQDRLMSERYQHYLRAEAAEAGEDALAEALRGATETLRGASRQLTEVHRGNLKGRVWGQMTLEIVSAALAAYEARRKG